MSEVQYKGHTINILQDDSPCDPREYENLGTMICFHRRYNLGDKHNIRFQDYKSFDEQIAALTKEQGELIWLPLYLYDHSGITINTTGFYGIDSAGWDWGQLGYIYVSKKKAREEFGWKLITKSSKEKIKDYLRAEVETYNQYLTNDVYGYNIENGDSCFGFFGSDHEKSGLLESAMMNIDCLISQSRKVMSAII